MFIKNTGFTQICCILSVNKQFTNFDKYMRTKMTVKKAIIIISRLLMAIFALAIAGQIFTNLVIPIFVLVALIFATNIYITFKYTVCPECGHVFGIRTPVGIKYCPMCSTEIE